MLDRIESSAGRSRDIFGNPAPEHDLTRSPAQPAQKRIRESKADRDWGEKAQFLSYMPAPADPVETIFRHSGWSSTRTRVREALASAGANVFALSRFDECGSECQIEWSEQLQKYRCRANHCKNRHCVPCAKARAARVARAIEKHLANQPKNGDRYRFVTLTQAHSDLPLLDQVKKLYSDFKKLRNTQWWKKATTGGAFVCELKTGRDNRWHVHMHCIVEGGWIDQRQLSNEWLKVSKNSRIVDVRKIGSARDAAWYVSKYITKSTDQSVWRDPDKAIELIVATRGLRIVNSFGAWRGIPLNDNSQDADDWQPIATLKALIARANGGEVHANQILILLRRPQQIEAAKTEHQHITADDPPPDFLD